MLTHEKIRNLHFCRDCLNTTYNLHLERKDVYISQFPEKCAHCKKVKNIVCDIGFFAKIRTIGHHKK